MRGPAQHEGDPHSHSTAFVAATGGYHRSCSKGIATSSRGGCAGPLDTVSIGRAAIRLCRSLAFDIWNDADKYLDDDDEAPPDSS